MWRTASYLETGGQIPLVEQEISFTFAKFLPDEKNAEEEAPALADD